MTNPFAKTFTFVKGNINEKNVQNTPEHPWIILFRSIISPFVFIFYVLLWCVEHIITPKMWK